MGQERILTRLEMRLEPSGDLSYQMSSLFHGVLMEHLPEEYAGYLHESRLHPFTQHLEKVNGEWIWIVTTFDEKASNSIIKDALNNLNEFELKRQSIKVKISEHRCTELSERVLLTRFYEEQSERYIKIRFITPTSFKRQGRYLIYPDMFCVFQSLMNKYDNSSGGYGMTDDDTLEQICSSSEIVKYNLRSTLFYLEGVKIPSFTGSITLRISENHNIRNFINLLFSFGEYSGVSPKTTLNADELYIRYKVAFTENFVLNELISNGIVPFFWRSGNTAEIDFIYENQGHIIPVEVKSADNTQAKGYRQFCKKYKPKRGYKLSEKNVGMNMSEETETYSLPLYMSWKVN